MLRIKIGKKENINQALKRFKRKVRDTKLIKEIRSRKEFLKPSVKKRIAKQKAIRSQKYNLDNEL